MADIARLGIRIDSGQVKVAAQHVDQLTVSGRDAEKSAGGLTSAWSRVSSTIITLNQGLQLAQQVYGKVKRAVDDLEGSYGIQERAETKLSAAIRATGKEAEIDQESLHDLASALQGVTTYGDEATISALAMLQQLSDLDEYGLQQITPRMLDFSAAMGVDLETSASLFGKTLGSTTNALSRYGIMIDMSGSKEEKLAELTEQLSGKFEGMAESLGEMSSAAGEQLSNAIGDLKEELGEMISEGLEPGRRRMTEFVTETTKAISEFRSFQRILSDGIEMPDTTLPLEQRINELQENLDEYRTALAGVDEQLQNWGESGNIAKRVIFQISEVLQAVFPVLGDGRAELLLTHEQYETFQQDLEGSIAQIEHQIGGLTGLKEAMSEVATSSEELSDAEVEEEERRKEAIAINQDYLKELRNIELKESELGDLYDDKAAKISAANTALDAFMDMEEPYLGNIRAMTAALRELNDEYKNLDMHLELVKMTREENIDVIEDEMNALFGLYNIETKASRETREALKEAKQAAADFKEELLGIGNQAIWSGIDALNATFRELGAGIAGAEDGIDSFGEWAEEFGYKLLEMAPGVLVQLASAMLTYSAGTMWPLAISLLVSAGVLSFAGGVADEALHGSAHGNAFDNGNIIPFDRGAAFTNSIIDRPTLFPMARGTGLMGEAGPEVVAPLFRTPSGDLGVKSTGAQVNIRVENYSGAEVSVEKQETPSGVDIAFIVKSAVKSGINEGDFDGTMKQNFGVSRQGIA